MPPRASRRIRRAAGVLGLIALGLAGCATRPGSPAVPVAPTISEAQAQDLLRRWAAEWEAFQGLRAATDLTIRTPRRNDRLSALLLLGPTALRVEVATPFGFPAVVATAGPDGITVFRTLERRAQTASPTPEGTARWLGVPLVPGVLVQLLVGHVPLPADPTTVRVETASPSHLVWVRDGLRHRVWPGPDGRPARLVIEADGRTQLVGTFERSPGGDLQSVRLEAPARDSHVLLRYVSAEYVAVPPDAFRLTLPPDIPVQRFD